MNLSSQELSSTEEVLRRGLNFAPAPQRIPYLDMIAGVESVASRLESSDANDLRVRVCSILKKAKPPAPNMTRQERTVVRSLRERSDLVILTADKGSATVVMDQSEYKKKIENLLEDPVYRTISKDPTSATESKITKELKLEQEKHSEVSDEQTQAYSEQTPQALWASEDPQARSTTTTHCVMHWVTNLPTGQARHIPHHSTDWKDQFLCEEFQTLCRDDEGGEVI